MSVKVQTNDGLRVRIENSANQASLEQMTDSGDNQTFTSGGTRFSLCEKDAGGTNRTPVLRPDGVQNGCFAEPAASGNNDALDVYAGKVWIGGSSVTVSAQTNIAVSRPSASMKMIVSIAIDAVGATLTITGTAGSEFSNQRGAAGGPPYIPAGNAELATVELDSSTSAPLKDEEVIFAPEFSHAPSHMLLPYSASVKFSAPLPLIHAGGTPKNVWITRYEPVLTAIDVISLRPPVAAIEVDPETGKARRGKFSTGSMVIPLSGNQSDLARKIDGTVRLFEFMPDSTGTRQELFYAAVETASNYSAEGLMIGTATLVVVEEPTVETV
ncbi:MAG: hypothetical protein IEMM0002_1232 [bacterium]|nr:MAG: hypothetical protein IEMM0002_1232 [bacterium]